MVSNNYLRERLEMKSFMAKTILLFLGLIFLSSPLPAADLTSGNTQITGSGFTSANARG